MIRLDMPQGSLAWMEARLGIPTASNFDKLITPGGKPSSSAEKYAWKCVAEQILNHPIQEKEEASGFMERGTIMQKNARAFYELQRDVETEEVGFMLRDNRRAGCSPDLLVKGGGLVEIKCPSAPIHIGYLLDSEGIGYRVQVQGQLWVSEEDWCDTLSFHPEMPSALVRQGRDEPFIKLIEAAVNRFNEQIDGMKAKLLADGYFPHLQQPNLKIA